MKILFSILFCLILGNVDANDRINVMTYNIRLNTASDSLNAWTYRKDRLAQAVISEQTDILGVQEALNDQMMDLQARLPLFAFVGAGRDDGKTKGEYSAIFYNKKRFELLKSETFWLSLTPQEPGSKSWDAAITRIVTWAQFRDSKTKKIFFVFNTHFDHIGKIARRESAVLLKQKVQEIAGNTPAIITGDFNARPADEPIMVLMDKKDTLHFIDTKEISKSPHTGPTGTFNGWRSKETDDQPIDYIFVKAGWKVWKHATIPAKAPDGRFASDHFAVTASLGL